MLYVLSLENIAKGVHSVDSQGDGDLGQVADVR